MASGHGVPKPNKANHPRRQVGQGRLWTPGELAQPTSTYGDYDDAPSTRLRKQDWGRDIKKPSGGGWYK